jgi:two-component system OmpR family response regulator
LNLEPGLGRRDRIAIVDDDASVRDAVCDLVATEGYEPIACADAAALFSALSGRVDLVVLDLRLPDRDGLAVAATVRSTSDVPIIILSGRGGDLDRIIGLEIGADDYVVKPFNTRELLARIKAVLRRRGREAPPPVAAAPAAPTQTIRRGLRFAGYEIDLDRRRLIGADGAQVALTVAEFDLLAALAGAAGRVLSREHLLELTHRISDDVFDRTIDVLVLRLRRKIEPTPTHPRFIRTERGHGYVFDVPVEAIEPA